MNNPDQSINQETTDKALDSTGPVVELVTEKKLNSPELKPKQKPQSTAKPKSKSTGKRSSTGEALHQLGEMRHNPSQIKHAFESGEYPYKSKIKRDVYEKHKVESRASRSPRAQELVSTCSSKAR